LPGKRFTFGRKNEKPNEYGPTAVTLCFIIIGGAKKNEKKPRTREAKKSLLW